jgi:hypothetical protein
MFALQHHRQARLAVAAALILLAACSGDDAPTDPGLPEPVPATTLNIAPAGGAWLVTARDGTELTLTVPAGAVEHPVTLEVTPEEPHEGGLARFRIETPGVILREPATVTLALPDGVPADGVFALYGEERRSLLPTTVDPDAGTAQTTIAHFGAPAVDPDKDGYVDGAVWLGMDHMMCLNDLQLASETLAEAEASEWYPLTVKECMDTVKALVQNCQQPEAAALVALITDRSLAANQDARLLAFNSPHDLDENGVRKGVEKLMSTAGLAVEVGADDDGEIAAATDEAIAHLLGNYINRMKERVDNDDYVEDNLWSGVWYQLRKIQGMEASAALLGQQKAEDRLREVQSLSLDQMRRASYRACRELHDQRMLADMHSGGHLEGQPYHPSVVDVPQTASFTGDDLLADMRWAVTDLELTAWDDEAPAQPIDGEHRRFAGGAEPGEVIMLDGNISVPVGGSLVLGGEAWAFQCADGEGVSWDAMELLVYLNGDRIDTIGHGGNGRFLETERRYLIDEVLADLGLPTDVPVDLELEILLTGSNCSEHHGFDDFVIAELEVEVEPAVEEPEPTLDGEWILFGESECGATIEVVQEGDAFTVTGSIGGQPGCGPRYYGSGSGTLAGDELTMGMAYSSGYSASFTGTVNAERTAMSGTYTVVGGGSGEWTAHRPGS